MTRLSKATHRAAPVAFALLGQIAVLLHAGASAPARAETAPAAASDTTAAQSRPALLSADALWRSPDPPRGHRGWFLWTTSALAVGAVVAVFAMRDDVDRAPARPDLPDFPDAP